MTALPHSRLGSRGGSPTAPDRLLSVLAAFDHDHPACP